LTVATRIIYYNAIFTMHDLKL